MKPDVQKVIEDLIAEYGKECAAEIFREGLILILGEENQNQDVPFEF